MKYIKSINEYINLPKDLNKNQTFRYGKSIDVAMMTFEEYLKIVNPSNKYHEQHWNYSVDDLNNSNITNKSEMTLLKRKKYGNLEITFYEQKDKKRYGRHDENNVYHLYTDQEILDKGLPLYDISIYVYHDDKKIGYIGDEWGATLVYLAREYSGNNIGKDLTIMFRKHEPDRDSGGFTNKGYANIKNVYREFVKEYLRNGIYSHLVKTGELTSDRVKEIISSADLQNYKPEKKLSDFAINYSTKFDENTLVFRYENNMDFVVFDKRIVNYYKKMSYGDFQMKHFLKAHIYFNFNTVFNRYELYNSYGLNENFEATTLAIALQTLKNEESEELCECLLRTSDDYSEYTKNIIEKLKNNKNFEYKKELEYPTIEAKQGFDYSTLFKKSLEFFKSLNRNDRDELENYLMEIAYYTSEK